MHKKKIKKRTQHTLYLEMWNQMQLFVLSILFAVLSGRPCYNGWEIETSRIET